MVQILQIVHMAGNILFCMKRDFPAMCLCCGQGNINFDGQLILSATMLQIILDYIVAVLYVLGLNVNAACASQSVIITFTYFFMFGKYLNMITMICCLEMLPIKIFGASYFS